MVEDTARILRILILLWACCFAAAFPASARIQHRKMESMRVVLTQADQSTLLKEIRIKETGSSSISRNLIASDEIRVDPKTRFQTMVGFGAAMTDASAYILKNRLDDKHRRAVMSALFSSQGLNLSFLRLTIGASDFSLKPYSYDDMEKGQTDPELKHFDMGMAENLIIPTIKEAQGFNPKLAIMASPWSAPGWMKSSDSLIAGTLSPEHYGSFATYLRRYVETMQASGIPIFALTLQNEPHFEPKDYPGMRVDPAARAEFIGQYLGPELEKAQLKTRILDWDHNWSEPNSPIKVLSDPKARQYISGIAWHCYAGDVQAQTPVHEAFPDKDVYFTECSGGDWAPKWDDSFIWYLKTLIIEATRGYAKGVLLWNLLLDENHGPHSGGCANCRGVMTIDSKTGIVTRNVEYYILGHASKFVKSGAQRIESNNEKGLETVAFLNPDRSRVLIVVNEQAQARKLSIREGHHIFNFDMPARAGATFIWGGSSLRMTRNTHRRHKPKG